MAFHLTQSKGQSPCHSLTTLYYVSCPLQSPLPSLSSLLTPRHVAASTLGTSCFLEPPPLLQRATGFGSWLECHLLSEAFSTILYKKLQAVSHTPDTSSPFPCLIFLTELSPLLDTGVPLSSCIMWWLSYREVLASVCLSWRPGCVTCQVESFYSLFFFLIYKLGIMIGLALSGFRLDIYQVLRTESGTY